MTKAKRSVGRSREKEGKRRKRGGEFEGKKGGGESGVGRGGSEEWRRVGKGRGGEAGEKKKEDTCLFSSSEAAVRSLGLPPGGAGC